MAREPKPTEPFLDPMDYFGTCDWPRDAPAPVGIDDVLHQNGLSKLQAAAIVDKFKDITGIYDAWPSSSDASDEKIAEHTVASAFRTLDDPVEAVKLLSEDKSLLNARISAANLICEPGALLLTLDELADILSDFIVQQQLDQKHIINDGIPSRCFSRRPSICRHLGNLYPVCYQSCKDCSLLPLHSPAESGSVSYPMNWPAFWGLSLSGSMKDPRRRGGVSSLDGKLLPFKNVATARRLQEKRRDLFHVKLKILERTTEAARLGDAFNLWPDCLTLLNQTISTEDVVFLCGIDLDYMQISRLPNRANQSKSRLGSGGIISLFEVVGHVECEIQHGILGQAGLRFAERLGSDWRSTSHTVDEPTLPYFRLIRKFGQERINKELDLFLASLTTSHEFWRVFSARASRSIQPKVNVPEGRHDEGAKLGTASNCHTVKNRSANERKPAPQRYPVIPNLKWHEVSMYFIDGQTLRIKARECTKTYSFVEMGLKDGRKGNRENIQWKVLREMAVDAGQPTTETYKRADCNARKAISKLRQVLRKFMSIDDDPFGSCKARWRPRFYLAADPLCMPDKTQKDDDDL